VATELHITVPGDNEGLIGAICILILIVHCRLKHDLSSLTPDQIICLVQSASLWNMAAVLVPFAKAWSEKLAQHLQETYPEDDSNEAQESSEQESLRQSTVTWALVDTILTLGCPATSQRALDIAFRKCVLTDAGELVSEHGESKESIWGTLRQLTGEYSSSPSRKSCMREGVA
jgi:hypothetical protein